MIVDTDLEKSIDVMNDFLDKLTPYFQHRLDPRLLPGAELELLHTLASARGPLQPTELSERSICVPVNEVSELLDRLRQRGYVKRAGRPSGRTVTWDLTEPLYRVWTQFRSGTAEQRQLMLIPEFVAALFSRVKIDSLVHEHSSDNAVRRRLAMARCISDRASILMSEDRIAEAIDSLEQALQIQRHLSDKSGARETVDLVFDAALESMFVSSGFDRALDVLGILKVHGDTDDYWRHLHIDLLSAIGQGLLLRIQQGEEIENAASFLSKIDARLPDKSAGFLRPILLALAVIRQGEEKALAREPEEVRRAVRLLIERDRDQEGYGYKMINVTGTINKDSPVWRVMGNLHRAIVNIAPENKERLVREHEGLTIEYVNSEEWVCEASPDGKLIRISHQVLELLWCMSYAHVLLYEKYLQGRDLSVKQVIDPHEDPEASKGLNLLKWALEKWLNKEGSAWPSGLPKPLADPEKESTENVADELCLCAAAVLMHHELSHVRLGHDAKARGVDSVELEREADYAAAEWILEHGLDEKDPRFIKRTLGLATALCTLVIRGVYTGDHGGDTHPRDYDRLLNTLDKYVTNEDHESWAFCVSMLSLHATNQGLQMPKRAYDTFRECVDAYANFLA